MNLYAKYISIGRVSPRTRFDTVPRTQERVYFKLRRLTKKKDKKVIKIKQEQENKTKKEKSSYLQTSV